MGPFTTKFIRYFQLWFKNVSEVIRTAAIGEWVASIRFKIATRRIVSFEYVGNNGCAVKIVFDASSIPSTFLGKLRLGVTMVAFSGDDDLVPKPILCRKIIFLLC